MAVRTAWTSAAAWAQAAQSCRCCSISRLVRTSSSPSTWAWISFCVSWQFKLRSLVLRFCQAFVEPCTRAGQAGHDRPDRDRGDRSNLLVGESFQLAEYDHFPQVHGQLGHGLVDRLPLLL